MTPDRRRWLAAGLGAALGAGAAPGVRAAAAPVAWPAIALVDGRTLAPEDWAGQGAVVVVWATFCPFCRRQNAHLEKLYRATRGQPLQVLGVALDRDAAAVRAYMAQHGYTFPVAADGERLRSLLTPRRVIPMTFVLDRRQQLRQAIPGEMFEEDVLDLGRIALAG